MMNRALPVLAIAPILAFSLIGLLGEGTAAAIVGIVIAGALGGLGAWLAFGRHHGPGTREGDRLDKAFFVSVVEVRVYSDHEGGRNVGSDRLVRA